VPVAPGEAVRRLKDEADEIRVLATPEPFFAVGQWYRSFPQVSDAQVIELLSSSTGESR
jgi:predicted phosphoribosyltransferase